MIVTFIFVPNIYGETTHFQNELHTRNQPRPDKTATELFLALDKLI